MGIGAFCWCVVMIVAGLVPTRSWWGKLWFSIRIFRRRAVHLVILSYSRFALVSTWNIHRTHTHTCIPNNIQFYDIYTISKSFDLNETRNHVKHWYVLQPCQFRPSKSNHPKRWNPTRWGGWGTSLPGKFVVNFSGSLPATPVWQGKRPGIQVMVNFFSTFLISSYF